MADKDAKVSIGIEGEADVARAADRALRPWASAATTAKTAFQGLGGAFSDVVRQTVSDGARLLSAYAAFDLSSRVPSVIQYREEIARLSVVTGQTSEQLRAKFAAQEAATLQSRQANEQFSNSFGRVIYNYQQGADAAKSLANEAIAANRNLSEMEGIGKVIYDATGKIENAPEVLGRIRAQAAALGTVGGPDALRDQLEGVGAVINKLATQSPEQLGNLTAALGAIGKGLRPDQAREAQQSILSKVFGDTRATERFLRSAGELKKGESILDEYGQVKDAAGTLAAYQRAWRKQAGSMPEAQRLARMYFGDLGGSAFMRAGYEEAQGLAPSTEAGQRADALRASEEGRRKLAQMAARGAQDDVAAKTLPAVDAVLGFAGEHPILAGIGALLGPGLASKGAGALLKLLLGGGAGASPGGLGLAGAGAAGEGIAATELATGANPLFGGLLTGGGAAGGAALGGGIVAGEAVATAAFLASIGVDRETMGRDYRKGHGGVEVLEAYGKAAAAAENAYAEDAPLAAYRAARSAGASKEDAEEIAKVIAAKVNSPVIKIINQTGGPIQAINEQGADASGSQ